MGKKKDFHIFQKKRKREEKKRENFQKALRLGALGSYFLGFFQKKKNSKFSIPWKNSRLPNFSKKKSSSINSRFPNFSQKKNHQSNFFDSLKEFKTPKFFQKKKNQQSNFFSIPWKNSRLPNFSKKKKKVQNFQFLEKIQDF